MPQKKRQPWQGMERFKSEWLLAHEESRAKGHKYVHIGNLSFENIANHFISNITTLPNFTFHPKSLNNLLKWATNKNNRANCFRWDGPYYQNRPKFALLKLIPPDTPNPSISGQPIPYTHFVETFMFQYAFGPWPSRKPLYPTRICIENGIGMPRGIPDAAWCVNPYHKMFSVEDSPRTHRRWAPEQMATLKRYHEHRTSFKE